MTINFQMPHPEPDLKPRITVIGVGGAGGNAVNNMIAKELQGGRLRRRQYRCAGIGAGQDGPPRATGCRRHLRPRRRIKTRRRSHCG